jgi:HSP20 family protein
MRSPRSRYLQELDRIQRRVDELFERVLAGREYAGREPGGAGWQPAVDVLETAGAFLVRAELPGMRREDLELEVHGRRLTLSGRRDPIDDQHRYQRMERAYGPFRRSFELAGDVDAQKIAAAYHRGVLEVTIPKRNPQKSVEVEG